MKKTLIDESASCACGAVTLSARGPVLSMLLCACLDCRKASGTAHSTVTIMQEKSVAISGETKGFARTANSGATITRHFCPQCGTPLFARSSRASELIMIATGIFDNPDWFAPNQLIFARSQLDWDHVPDGIAQYETYRPRD